MRLSVELLMEYGLAENVARRLALLWEKKCDEVRAQQYAHQARNGGGEREVARRAGQ